LPSEIRFADSGCPKDHQPTTLLQQFQQMLQQRSREQAIDDQRVQRVLGYS
jgi:hypothetical protein